MLKTLKNKAIKVKKIGDYVRFNTSISAYKNKQKILKDTTTKDTLDMLVDIGISVGEIEAENIHSRIPLCKWGDATEEGWQILRKYEEYCNLIKQKGRI